MIISSPTQAAVVWQDATLPLSVTEGQENSGMQTRTRWPRRSNNWELFSLRNGTMGLIWSSLCAELSCCLSLSHSQGECEWVAVGLLSECPRQCWPCARHTTRDRKATTLNCPAQMRSLPFRAAPIAAPATRGQHLHRVCLPGRRGLGRAVSHGRSPQTLYLLTS